jgi:hypothetical protein
MRMIHYLQSHPAILPVARPMRLEVPFRSVTMASLFITCAAGAYATLCFEVVDPDQARYKNEETGIKQDEIQALICTFALGITAPVGSDTIPAIDVLFSGVLCGWFWDSRTAPKRATKTLIPARLRFIIHPFSLPQNCSRPAPEVQFRDPICGQYTPEHVACNPKLSGMATIF